MIRLDGTITWPDGRTQAIVVTQREWTDWELWAIRHGVDPSPTGPLGMTMQRYLGYACAQRAAKVPRAEWPAFEDWTADDVTLEGDAAETGEAVSAAAVPFPADRSVG